MSGREFCVRIPNKVITCLVSQGQLDGIVFLLKGALIAYFLGWLAAVWTSAQKLDASIGV